jgi:hypothetical protein
VARTPVRRLIERGIEAGADYIPDVIEGPLRRAFSIDVPKSKASKPKASLAVKPKALPAPPKQLALPAPGPGLPPLASKPRGGQFWVDKDLIGNTSPEAAARQGALGMGAKTMRWQADEPGVIPLFTQTVKEPSPEQQWLERALTKYYKNEFGSPDDPLRSLAERGLHYEPDMTPEKWKATVDSYLGEDKIGDITVPTMLFDKDAYPGVGDTFTTEARMAMPWLAKLPVTDKLYSIQSGGLDLNHFTDEFYNALNPETSGLPMDLAVRPESLGRMTFPQAAERVGLINQFRAKEMERAALGNLDSPAVQTFKEYTENNPMGLRWTELKAPEAPEPPVEWGWEPLGDGAYLTPEGTLAQRDPNRVGGFQGEDDYYHHPLTAGGTKPFGKQDLEEALKYEGDTMGHCVGGYCDDVMEGRSRIFSLRDAKGEPHVTIETSPYTQWLNLEHAADTDQDFGDAWNQWRYGYDLSRAPGRPEGTFEDYLRENDPDLLSRFEGQSYAPDEIVQIKGKQNRAPKDDYLPFVQDFVKSQQWGNIGDFGNTGLVKLPDGRYITDAQYREGALKASKEIDYLFDPYANRYRLPDEDWDAMRPYFEGYAIGGRVCADRCFSKGKSAVYAVK